MLAFATLANARDLSMTGEWYMNRGPLIDIPTNGGQTPCGGGAPNGCVGNVKPILGGIPGAATITGVAPGPAPSFVVPPNVFGQALGKQVAAVAIIPTVVQLSSTWTLMGPPTAVSAAPTVPPQNIPAAFMKNAWMMDPGQAARLQKSFTFCFGTGPPPHNCTNSKAGPYTGLIRYSNSNPNAFGGTMSMMINGNGVVSVLAGGPSLLGHQLVGPGAPGNPQHPGRGYDTFDTDVLVGGPVHFGFMTSPPCTVPLPALPPGCGLVTSSGPVVGSMPPDSNWNWGQPWTTGTVTAQNVQPGGTTTLTGMGSDSRTAWGAGKITLVAGGSTRRKLAAQDYSAVDVVTMTFAPPVPSMSTPGLAAGGLLILLAVGYAVRRRF
jgi:hypothetical protein